MKLPTGIWFEPKRNRYRVRLYLGPTVIHRSYHKTMDEAMWVYTNAKINQASAVLPKKTIDESLLVSSIIKQLKTL